MDDDNELLTGEAPAVGPEPIVPRMDEPRTMVEAIRQPDDLDTHIDRINGPEMSPPVEPNQPTQFAHEDHPAGEQWPYRAMEKVLSAASHLLPAGTIQWLFPHEVGPHHRHAPEMLVKDEPPEEPPA